MKQNKNDSSSRTVRARRSLVTIKLACAVGLIASSFSGPQTSARTGDPYASERPEESRLDPMGLYFNVGVLGDIGITGYNSAAANRNTRIVYQLEVGTQSYALPLTYSTGQSVNILGIKPRIQHFVRFGDGFFSAGGDLGAVYSF